MLALDLLLLLLLSLRLLLWLILLNELLARFSRVSQYVQSTWRREIFTQPEGLEV